METRDGKRSSCRYKLDFENGDGRGGRKGNEWLAPAGGVVLWWSPGGCVMGCPEHTWKDKSPGEQTKLLQA